MKKIKSQKVILSAISIVMLSLVVPQSAQAGKFSSPPSCSFTVSGVTQDADSVIVPLYLNAGTVPGGTAYVGVSFNFTWNDTYATAGSWQTTLIKPNWSFNQLVDILYIGDLLNDGSEIYSANANFFYYGKNGRSINSNNVGCTVS
jgi:hypothetical protein